ncbi:MAG: FAD-dependent oxidoreductase, partial [Actinobacteria bacterium]|nr:FAD-dependent oxidoreductase [Actinomycetota bacterium]
TLREEGSEGGIVLVGSEAELPYERPPLSKDYLGGTRPFEKLLVRPPDVYESLGIELRLGVTARSVNAGARTVELTGGETLPYDRLLIATGGRNRRPPIPGLELDGVFDLRTHADADRIREEAKPGRRAVVVGMGFIGCEVAATLRGLGVEVSAVEAFAVPLERVLGAEVGRTIEELHCEHGVETVLGEAVAGLEGNGRVERVRTAAGRVLDCDFAVVGLGIEPAVEIVAGTRVEVDDGILVDELCRTSVDGIYAAGDVARHRHPLFGTIRVEHWLNAIEQGQAAARSMLGKGAPYDNVHWFWSDQYEDNLQYTGHHVRWDELVVRGSLAERKFAAFYLEGGAVRAAVALNQGRDVRRAQPLIRAKVRVDPAELRDPEVDLRLLVPREG